MKRTFKIREHILKNEQQQLFDDRFPGSTVNKPVPDVVWMRYNLTLRAMEKSFSNTEDMFDYVCELEDFIFSAATPYNSDIVQ